jgi:hypothetical protein
MHGIRVIPLYISQDAGGNNILAPAALAANGAVPSATHIPVQERLFSGADIPAGTSYSAIIANLYTRFALQLYCEIGAGLTQLDFTVQSVLTDSNGIVPTQYIDVAPSVSFNPGVSPDVAYIPLPEHCLANFRIKLVNDGIIANPLIILIAI